MNTPAKGYHAQESTPESPLNWNYTLPPSDIRNSKLQLLTVGGVAVHGQWYGRHGEYFVGWAPLLKVDKDQFEQAIRKFRDNHDETYIPD